MKIKVLSFIIISTLIVVFFFSCAEEDNSVNPPSGEAIVNTSFEKDGQPSSDGWSLPSVAKFSTDVPDNGGNYSLQLEATQPPESYAEVQVPVLDQSNNYKLSFWSRTDGVTAGIKGKAILTLIRDGSDIKSKSVLVEDITWRSYSIADTFSIAEGDSFLIQLTGGITPSLLPGKTYFDLCRLEAVD